METPADRGFVIERMTPAGVARVRDVRFRALADTPDAFGMTIEEERATPAADWIARLARDDAATFVATAGGRDVGLAVGAPYAGAGDGDAGLFAMWVDPGHRGLGVGGALVDAVVGWARGRGCARVVLDVADGNDAAVRLYEGRGFRPTGDVGTLPPPRQHVREHRRALDL